jgi:hypothetical protein
MKSFLLSAFIILSLFFPHSGFCEESQDRVAGNECVILLDGLGRTERSMAKIKARLDKERNRSFDPWFSFMIEGDDDEKVSVEQCQAGRNE